MIGRSYWKTIWAYLDAGYGFLNLVATFLMLTNQIDTPYLRIFQAITAIIIWFKALYYI